MEKVIYENESSKLIAKYHGDIVQLTQYLGDELIGEVTMFSEEVKEVAAFVDEASKEEVE